VKRSRYLSVALLTCSLLLAPHPATAAPMEAGGERLFLWKVTSPTNTVYLLGSIHVATEDFYPLPEEVEKAFAASKVLAVEVDLTKVDAGAMQGAMMEKGMYPGGDSVARHVPKETLEKLRAYFAGKGMPAAALEQFRPWALAVTITMLEMQTMGYSAEMGIDKHFMDSAGNKPIVELETADAQIALLSGFPEKLEAEFLASTLESMADSKKLMGQMVEAWKAGDAETLERITLTEPLKERPDLRGVYAKMFDERNVKMAAKVEGFLKKRQQPHFVVVGAGHLIGDKGIVKLLAKKGFKVEQITRDGKAAKPAAVAPAAPAKSGEPAPARSAEPAPAKSRAKRPARDGYAPADAWAK
jgi:uncharacterized protein YbaP (TraB family)